MNPVWTDRPRVSLWVDADDPIVSQHLIQHGDWDAPLAAILEDVLHEGDVFLDLGAHVGYFSLVAQNHCRTIAVEPQAELCELMRQSGVEDVRQVAVGEPGIRDIFIPDNRGAASFHHEIGRRESVEVVPLSDFSDATVAKIDIEGDEGVITDEFLSGLRMVVFEHQLGKEAQFEQVQNAGFDIYKINPAEQLDEPPWLPEGLYLNLVGVRDGH